MRWFLWGAGLLACLLALVALVAGPAVVSLLSPASAEKKEILVTIPRGASAAEIGRLLEQAGVIRSARAFRYLVALSGKGATLKAGEHILDPSLSTPEIIDSLIKGRLKLYRLTVPEGLTLAQVARLAGQSGLADPEEFFALGHDPEMIASLGLQAPSLEGYLFPETYYFVRETTARRIIQTMVRRFEAVWETLPPRAGDLGLTRHEVVILASIVEKETAVPAERPLIAATFLNRLRRGMRLESDPTVIYGLKDFDGNLTRQDLETPTPYNTYQIDGLPPGPICNPGAAGLRAVLEPAPVDYLFFVSKNDGTHHFSHSLTQHNRAVNQYQRRRRRP